MHLNNVKLESSFDSKVLCYILLDSEIIFMNAHCYLASYC